MYELTFLRNGEVWFFDDMDAMAKFIKEYVCGDVKIQIEYVEENKNA